MTAVTLTNEAPAGSRRASSRIGWALSGLAILFFAMDGGMKVVNPPFVAEATGLLGWPTDSGFQGFAENAVANILDYLGGKLTRVINPEALRNRKARSTLRG